MTSKPKKKKDYFFPTQSEAASFAASQEEKYQCFCEIKKVRKKKKVFYRVRIYFDIPSEITPENIFKPTWKDYETLSQWASLAFSLEKKDDSSETYVDENDPFENLTPEEEQSILEYVRNNLSELQRKQKENYLREKIEEKELLENINKNTKEFGYKEYDDLIQETSEEIEELSKEISQLASEENSEENSEKKSEEISGNSS
ncbi:MAG: hypothetical protein NZZ41_04630 [Candidatus Dojkabacteria bacterium]|nr:hypothetical protein [Candidatus Dojkabacteria bacterium]